MPSSFVNATTNSLNQNATATTTTKLTATSTTVVIIELIPRLSSIKFFNFFCITFYNK